MPQRRAGHFLRPNFPARIDFNGVGAQPAGCFQRLLEGHPQTFELHANLQFWHGKISKALAS
jgi:hypothetical protein